MIQFSNHAIKSYDVSLQKLHNSLLEMAGRVDGLLVMTGECLSKSDAGAHEKAKQADKLINADELAIDAFVADILSKYNPLGEELRYILSALKISSILERIGDLAKGCIKRLGKMETPMPDNARKALLNLLKQVRDMHGKGLDNLRDFNSESVARLLNEEDEADALYHAAREIANKALAVPSGKQADSLQLLFVARNLERIADLIVDLLKISYFIHHGKKFEK